MRIVFAPDLLGWNFDFLTYFQSFRIHTRVQLLNFCVSVSTTQFFGRNHAVAVARLDCVLSRFRFLLLLVRLLILLLLILIFGLLIVLSLVISLILLIIALLGLFLLGLGRSIIDHFLLIRIRSSVFALTKELVSEQENTNDQNQNSSSNSQTCTGAGLFLFNRERRW